MSATQKFYEDGPPRRRGAGEANLLTSASAGCAPPRLGGDGAPDWPHEGPEPKRGAQADAATLALAMVAE